MNDKTGFFWNSESHINNLAPTKTKQIRDDSPVCKIQGYSVHVPLLISISLTNTGLLSNYQNLQVEGKPAGRSVCKSSTPQHFVKLQLAGSQICLRQSFETLHVLYDVPVVTFSNFIDCCHV
jgi:hypothetical protein